ncbi:MAG: YbbR-like domain-containing protein [Parabacteroides sp.]|nr:YbbR-like domain-containing protein [Parabacteroides sp.]
MSRLEVIISTFKSAPKKIKTLLRQQRWKEVLIFFFFVLLSMGFWMLQSLQQDYEIELSIPVRYKNVPTNIAFSDTLPNSIKVKVRDKGSVLLNYSLGRTFLPIEPSLNSLSNKKGTFVISKKVIESDILKQLIATTTLIRFEPQMVKIPYTPLKSRNVPVEFNGSLRTKPGYALAGDITISPSVVKVYSGENLLDSITTIKTAFTKIDGAKKTFTRTFNILPIKGVRFEPEVVTITFPIEEYTEKTLNIPVKCSNLPKEYTLRTFPSSVQVTCNVPLSRFKQLNADEFAVEVLYADLEQNVSGTVSIKLTKKPDWILSPTIHPDKIEFILEQNN